MDVRLGKSVQESSPLVSCIMPTYGRPDFVGEAIAMFLAQDYPRKELIILNDCAGQVLEFSHPEVVIINEEQRYPTLGQKRNAAISRSKGELLAVWDDDDVYLPWRLSFSVGEMERYGSEFYRPTEFWAYWGEEHLHRNQSVPGWVSHGCAMFTRTLWDRVGRYPVQNLNEDSMFFEQIHRALDQEFIAYPIRQEDKFFILRGKSKYSHMSIGGGENPLDVTPGLYPIEAKSIADQKLRQHADALIQTHLSIDGISESLDRTEDIPHASRVLISVCVALRNRSRVALEDGHVLELFPNFVRSLATVADEFSEQGIVELVVADFQSDDWPLEEWLADFAVSVQVKVVRIKGRGFSRGHGLNRAVAAATSDRLFLCDADMLLESETIQRAIQIVDSGKSWFPTYQCLDRNGVTESWQDLSYGMAALSREMFFKAGSVPEFESWGGEDDLFYEAVSRATGVVRERCLTLKHQWHPESIRHIHYSNPRKSDYERYIEEISNSPGTEQELLYGFMGNHPHWRGKVLLFKNGRMTRPGIDRGSFELTDQRLTLKWDRWKPETLVWDEKRKEFRDEAKGFVLKQLNDSLQLHDEDLSGAPEEQDVVKVPARIRERMLAPILPRPFQAFYHVACLNHWQEVFQEQMTLFREVGLEPTVGVLGTAEDVDWVRAQGAEIGFHSENFKLYETPTLELAWNWSRQHPQGAVLYVHTKGVSIVNNAHKTAWRKFMSLHLIRSWSQNLEYLAIVDTVGVNWMDHPGFPHYCGNFWMARADWISQLASPSDWKNRPDPDPWIANRPWNPMADEMWLGSNEPCQAVSLACRNRRIWEGSDLFRSLPVTGKTLSELHWGLSDRTDKGTVHTYIDFYDEALREFQDKPITLMEIGVGQGGSLDLWDRYFTHPETRVIGVDIQADPLKVKRIEVIKGDGRDGNLAQAIGPIDILIDDGSHAVSDQMATFRVFYPQLKSGGLYVIEDVASDEAAAQLQAIHEFTDVDLRGLKNRFDDRILWTRKQPESSSSQPVKMVTVVLGEADLADFLQGLPKGSIGWTCVCAGFWPSLELRRQFPGVTYAMMPRTCVESFGKFPWGGWLDAIDAPSETDLFIYTESRLQQHQSLGAIQQTSLEAYDSCTLGLLSPTNDHRTLSDEATILKMPDFASEIYQADWSTIPVWNLDVMAGRTAAFRQLRQAYEAEHVRFHALTRHPDRHIWLVSWLIYQLGLRVEPLNSCDWPALAQQGFT